MLVNRPENAWGSSLPARVTRAPHGRQSNPRRSVAFARQPAEIPPFPALRDRARAGASRAGAAAPPSFSVDELQARVGVLLPARLGQRAAVDADDVGGEVVLPAQQ